ncbi:MAG: tRNA (adenosine(37)-N6)-threonylcarbamoyltransferase complex ATPase subunit type 1 TsaE [Acidobacteria bacterium]|nr:MAG: tRNA (adenosine(37)-N6)-threonylcarbamoyltransferase complex ATPase subunit type 1 TsaE [Acidobacteriota bacterium]
MPEQRTIISNSPDETFEFGETLGRELRGGEVILLRGGLGAGKTLLTKGILSSLDYDIDEVTSPSFTLVNLYRAERFNVYHIDLWRCEGDEVAFSVGLDEIVEERDRVVIIEWAERLGEYPFESIVYQIDLQGDGDEPRTIQVERSELTAPQRV